MATNESVTKIRVSYDGKEAERGLNNFAKATKAMIAAVAGTVILQKLAGFYGDCAEAAKKQIEAEAQLTAALGKQSPMLVNQANALQRVTKFSDDATLSAQAMLAAYIKDEEQVKKLTPAVQDLATGLNMDLNSAALIVAKSIGGTTNMLGRYGIEIKKGASETERMNAIVSGITKKFGGMAEAMGATPVGQLEIAKNRLDDIKEVIGKDIIPLQTDWFTALAKLTGAWTTMHVAIKNFGRELAGTSSGQIDAEKRIAAARATGGAEGRVQLRAYKKDLEETFAIQSKGSEAKETLLEYDRLKEKLKDVNLTMLDREYLVRRIFGMEKLDTIQLKLNIDAVNAAYKQMMPSMARPKGGTDTLSDEEIERARKQEKEDTKAFYDDYRATMEEWAKISFETKVAAAEKELDYQQKALDKSLEAQKLADQTRQEWMGESTEGQLRLLEEEYVRRQLIIGENIDLDKWYLQERDKLYKEGFQKTADASLEVASGFTDVLQQFSDRDTQRAIDNLDRKRLGEKRYNKEREKLLKEQESRERAFARVQQAIILGETIMDIAKGSSTALKKGFWGIPELIFVAAQGALQIATIQAQKFATGFLGETDRIRRGDTINARIGKNEAVIPAQQYAMHEEDVRAIVNNTANTAAGLRSMRGGTTIQVFGLSTEQVSTVIKDNERRQYTGKLI